MMSTDAPPAGNLAPITEDEAALYDRQIRLWGLEAQQRMRGATILVINLKGLATEVIKNIVLAGIGKLIVMDGENVKEEDLGAGFFFRDEDVGKNRAVAAKSRIESLNPLVTVEIHPSNDYVNGDLDAVVSSVDLVCVTDLGPNIIVRLNECCERFQKKFYCGATFGLLGFIFCDLGRHEYVAKDRSSSNEEPKNIKHTAIYPSFGVALQHSWKGLTKRQTKELNPAAVISVMAVLQWQGNHDGDLPDDAALADALEISANTLLKEREVNAQTITTVPRERAESLATTAAHEFSPICAVVGGFLAQDILRTLSAKDAPLANFFTFDGTIGGGTIIGRWAYNA